MYQSEEGKILFFSFCPARGETYEATHDDDDWSGTEARAIRIPLAWPASLLLRGIREIGAALEFGGKSVQALWVLSLSLSLCAGGPLYGQPTRYRGPDIAVCLLCSKAARGKGFLFYTRRGCGMVVGAGRCWAVLGGAGVDGWNEGLRNGKEENKSRESQARRETKPVVSEVSIMNPAGGPGKGPSGPAARAASI